MKTFTQYYFEQRYWIWQSVFLLFFLAVTIAAVHSGQWETVIAVVLAAAVNVAWYYRAKGIYRRLVRLGHEFIAPEGATHYYDTEGGKKRFVSVTKRKDYSVYYCPRLKKWQYLRTSKNKIFEEVDFYKPIHRSKTPKK